MRNTHPLTPRQKETLLLVLSTICFRQRPPTYREMAAHLGIVSPNAIACLIDALADKGWLEREQAHDSAQTALRVLGVRCYVKAARGLALVLDDSEQGWRLAQLLSGTIALAEDAT